MRFLTFKGGIHPPTSKQFTKDIPIKELPAPEEVIIPMNQHIGISCSPLVKKGDKVKMYQKIGEPEGYLGAPVHASVSGEVLDVSPRLLANGSMSLAVVIKNDFKDTPEKCKKQADFISNIREAGIVGMGGAGFPIHVKLSPPAEKIIDTVIVNGCECEPYLTSDYRVMKETPKEVVRGLKNIMDALKVEKGIIAIEKNKKDVAEGLEKAVGKKHNIKIKILKTKYPQGSEKQLISALLKREVPEGGLPADAHAVVVNVDTSASIARANRNGTPVTSRVVTVSGNGIKNPCNYRVRIGTPVREIIKAAGGVFDDAAKIIMGGPMMGISLFTTEVPAVKTTGAILVLTEKEAKEWETRDCIRCGKCVTACPMGLLPLDLCTFSLSGEIDKCIDYGIKNCIECGACSYICPSRRHIVQAIRTAKMQMKK